MYSYPSDVYAWREGVRLTTQSIGFNHFSLPHTGAGSACQHDCPALLIDVLQRSNIFALNKR